MGRQGGLSENHLTLFLLMKRELLKYNTLVGRSLLIGVPKVLLMPIWFRILGEVRCIGDKVPARHYSTPVPTCLKMVSLMAIWDKIHWAGTSRSPYAVCAFAGPVASNKVRASPGKQQGQYMRPGSVKDATLTRQYHFPLRHDRSRS